jgi:alginate O-acetyltransferase complex protein AlgI
MDISSLPFLFLFLPVFLLIYLVSKPPLKLPIVLAASVIFISWEQLVALWWLGGITISGYLIGLLIEKTREKDTASAIWLWAGLAINILILSFFKFSVAYGEAGLILLHFPQHWIVPAAGLAVPVGLSYLTFQVISYLADVWRRNIPAEKNLAALSAYLLFFPKLVSGPITRYKSFALEMESLNPSTDDVAAGFRRLLAGFVKRALIANQLALIANAVFNLPTANIEPKFAWLALIAYTLQIFFDFSGYTDMAIGLGMMIGIRLPENFNFPYIAQSIGDFWRRWHVTLATWFREYVFFPLERRRIKLMGQQINIMVVFLFVGLWHGFKSTFIIWGLLHGLAVAMESLGLERLLAKIWRPIRHLYTLAIIMTGWVFFRSNTLDFAYEFFHRLAGDTSNLTLLPYKVSAPMPFVDPTFVLALTAGVFFSLPFSFVWKEFRASLEKRRAGFFFPFQVLEDALLVLLFVLGIAMLLNYGFTPNLYAKF